MVTDPKILAPQNKSRRLVLLGLILGLLTVGMFGLASTVLAQGTNLGLNEFAANTNLGTNVDLIGTIARIINIALGFLGVIAIVLILYAGWLWITSKGEAQKIEKAKKIMTGAVIGLAIILSAFAIASFIIKQIQNATTGGGGINLCWDGNPPPCPPPIFGGNYLSVRSQGPMGNGVKLCEAVQAGFSEAVQWSTINQTNFSIQEAATNTPFTSGTYQPGVDANNISFTHFGNEFAPNTAYRVTLRSGSAGILGVTNLSLRTDKVWTFTTGTESDDTAPTVEATQPPDGGTEVCRQTPIQVVFSEPMLATSFINNVLMRDEAGNEITLSAPTFGDGYRIANFTIQQELNAFTTYEVTLNGGTGGITDTCGIPLAADYIWSFETGETTDCTPEITSVVPDRRDYGQVSTITGSNLFLDGEVYVNNYPADSNSFPSANPPENILCWAGISRDGGTTSCTSSQIRFRAPVGSSTGPAYDQAGFTSTVGETHLNIAGANSNELPFTITSPVVENLSPNSGGIGQYVTVSGWNFGDVPGQVRFVRSDGTYMLASPPEVCSDWWQETEIIIKVPVGLVAGVTYQVEVVTAASGTNGGSKRSNSESFLVNSQPPGPGICTLLPASSPLVDLPISVTVTGERFGANRGSSVLTFDNANNINSSNYTAWSEGEIIALTPTGVGNINLLGSGNWRGQVKVNGVLSNWKNFNVGPDTNVYPQVVESAACTNDTQSPSPYKNTTDACGNALISARFTIPMDPATLTVGASGNIRVEECGNGVSPGACTINISFNPATYIYDAQNNVVGFRAIPNTGLRPNYWYRGTITTNVASQAGASLQNEYIWNFRVASAACPLNSVMLSPSYATIRELVPDPASTQSFSASATASNCNLINPQDYSWAWTAANNPADPPPPSRIQLLGGGNSSETSAPSNSIEALAYTPAGEPAKFKVEAVGENKSDTSDVYVSTTFCTEIEDCNACGAGISRCVAGVCEPVITNLSPADGAPGTWLTISGCYFGATRGQITYAGGRPGLWPDPAICGPSTWSNTQVISEVPTGASSGSIILERASPPGGSASSTPLTFTVNNVSRPGLCRITPNYFYETDLGTAEITIDGNNFGNNRRVANTSANKLFSFIDFIKKAIAQSITFPANQDNVNFFWDIPGLPVLFEYYDSASNYLRWSNNRVQAVTTSPRLPGSLVGQDQVSVNKMDIESNRITYTVLPGGGGGVGESCDLVPATQACEINNNFCRPGLTCDANQGCTCQPGSTQPPRIVGVTPLPGATNICRNTVLQITFDQPVNGNTIRNGQLEVTYDGICQATSNPANWRKYLAKFFSLFLPAFGQGILGQENEVSGRLSVNGNVITFTPNAPLCIGERYSVSITSPNVDCANSNYPGGNYCNDWQFTTGADICIIEYVDITPPSRLYTAVGQQQVFNAQAKSADWENLAANYTWEEQDPSDVVTIYTSLQQAMTAEANNKNGEAALEVTATGLGVNAGTATNSAALTVQLCEVPWLVTDANYDFNLMYCRGATDDPPEQLLPDFSSTFIAGTGDLLREYLFKHPDKNEVIGLRIYSNPKHLSPQQWYETRPDITQGNPSAINVDGYKALKDVQSTYVGAVAKPNNGSDLYTNIYVLSFNQGASAETLEIYNQLVKYWLFNPVLVTEQQQRLQRDLIRLQDMAYLDSKLMSYEATRGSFPKLPAGSFMVGKSTSVWSSWQAELGNELGTGLPTDPINKFVNCPAGYDPVTCWRSSDKSFICPAGSHAYQYTVGSNGNSYTLNANLEFKNVTWLGTPQIVIGNSDACDSYSSTGSGGTILNDNTPPEPVSLIVTPEYTPDQFTISWTAATDSGGSGLSHYELWRAPDIPGNSPGVWQQVGGPIFTRSKDDAPLADGGYWYGIRAVDNNDNSTPEQQPVLVFKDSVAPNDPVCNPPAGNYSTVQQVSCSATDQESFVTQVSVHFTSGSSTPSCGSPVFNNLTTVNTTGRINFIACDAAGNASSVVSHDYVITQVLPTATLTIDSRDSLGNQLSGAEIILDGKESGQTPTTATVTLGSHNVSFGNSLACYQYVSTNPAQPMDISSNTSVTATYTAVVPATVTIPSPASAAANVAINTQLSWSVAACSTSYDVYFGTSQSAVQNATTSSPEYRTNTSAATYAPTGLNYLTPYYWRIDARNSAGVTKGTVWSFTTSAAPTATINITSQDSNSMPLTGVFTWLDGNLVGATPTSATAAYGSHTVQYENSIACYTYDYSTPTQPMSVSGNATVVGTYNQNSPSITNNPSPASGATGVASDAKSVSWGSGGCSASFDVYFGTSQTAVQNATTSSSEYRGNVAVTTWSLPSLANATTYYWRIDARNVVGVSKGNVWSFTTENPANLTLTLAARNDVSSPLPGAPVRIDGVSVGVTPTTAQTNLGSHTVTFENSVNCHTYASTSPVQPMTVTGNASVTGTYNRTSAAQVTSTGISPSSSANNVSINTSLSWTAANCATGYNVYFGQSATSLSQVGSVVGLSYTPTSLVYATTYYWRVDSVNNGLVTTGNVWSFTTENPANLTLTLAARNDVGTALANAPIRLDGVAVGVTPTTTLTNLGSHTVSFDNTVNCHTYNSVAPTQPMNVTGNATITATYNRNAPQAINTSSSISPANSATNVLVNTSLSWSAANCATGYNVYFGQSATSLSQVGSVVGLSYTPTSLVYATTYYWRVDSVNNGLVTTGQVFSFTTEATPTVAVTFQSRNSLGVVISGATARIDGTYIGLTPITSNITIGNHTASFDDTLSCYSYVGIASPPQPMNLTGNVTVVGTFAASLPGAVTYFNPGNGATNISVTPTLSWNANCATSYDVYLGTNQTAVFNATPSSSEFKTNTTNTSYTSPALNYSTTYYWRIDARSSAGVSKGSVRSFTTEIPPNHTISFVAQDTNGASLPGAIVRLDGVYIGGTPTSTTAPQGVHSALFENNLTCYSGSEIIPAQPMTVTANTTVIGKYDMVMPSITSNPSPYDGATITSDSLLSWSAGGCTSSFDVYIGTDYNTVFSATTSSLVFRGNTNQTNYSPGTLTPGQTYYWRIDARNSAGFRKGNVWSFSTESTVSLTLQTRSSSGADISGALARVDGVFVGYSPVSVNVSIGSHSVSFDDTMVCYNFNEIIPTQPMSYTSNNVVTGVLNLIAPGAVNNPSPSDGSTISGTTVSWQAGSCTSSFNLYLGTNRTAVENANISSPEYIANTFITSYGLGSIITDGLYYWRVDSVNSSGVTKGNVWSFITQ